MNWQIRLISIYDFLDQEYHNYLWPFCQRFSNNNTPRFSDVEVITIYLWGILMGHKDLKKIYLFTAMMLGDWFPHLPSYVSFVRRLNRMDSLFPVLIERLQAKLSLSNSAAGVYLVDSFPVVMANAKRSGTARVANSFAKELQCASKGFYFHGIKVHIIAQKQYSASRLHCHQSRQW